MLLHWKSLLKIIRINGNLIKRHKSRVTKFFPPYFGGFFLLYLDPDVESLKPDIPRKITSIGLLQLLIFTHYHGDILWLTLIKLREELQY